MKTQVTITGKGQEEITMNMLKLDTCLGGLSNFVFFSSKKEALHAIAAAHVTVERYDILVSELVAEHQPCFETKKIYAADIINNELLQRFF